MRLSTKALVIGGGPAGATAAGLLAQSGTDVFLVEKKPSFIKPCGGALSLNAFEEFDIPCDLIKREVRKILIVSPRGRQQDIELQSAGLAIIERGDFDTALRRKAEEKGAGIIEGEFIGLTGKKQYSVQVDTGGRLCEILSEYIVAADGVNSRVRTFAGIKPLRSLFTASERIQEVSRQCCEFWFGSSHAPYSYSWIFPASEGISIGTGSFASGTIQTCLQKFKERTGIRLGGKKRIYRVPLWAGDLYNKGKILFAGDSAGQVMPLTYEGIYYAMKAGEYAAQAVVDSKVKTYKKMWRDRFQERFLLMDRLRKYFLKDDESLEKLVAMHKRPEVQEASLKLWIRKEHSKESLMNYFKLFGKLLR